MDGKRFRKTRGFPGKGIFADLYYVAASGNPSSSRDKIFVRLVEGQNGVY